LMQCLTCLFKFSYYGCKNILFGLITNGKQFFSIFLQQPVSEALIKAN
jgi:hypothetical protein